MFILPRFSSWQRDGCFQVIPANRLSWSLVASISGTISQPFFSCCYILFCLVKYFAKHVVSWTPLSSEKDIPFLLPEKPQLSQWDFLWSLLASLLFSLEEGEAWREEFGGVWCPPDLDPPVWGSLWCRQKGTVRLERETGRVARVSGGYVSCSL